MKTLTKIGFLAVLAVVSASAQPVVNAVLNNASYALPPLPNANIARGSLFVVFGAGLATGSATATSFPIPTSMSGASIKVTVGGTTVDCLMIYTTPGQVGAVLPSNTPVGTGQLVLTLNGQASASRAITVVNSSFGIFTANQAGSGPGAIQIARSETNRPTVAFNSPVRPGEAMIIWGTGLGPIATNDGVAPTPADLPVNVEVWVGSKRASVSYKGRSGCCTGIDQIVFTVPDGVEGCYVPVVVKIDDIVSNFSTIAVARTGQTVCSDANGYTQSDLDKAQTSGNLRVGGISLIRTASKFSASGQSVESKADAGSGYFVSYNLAQLQQSQGLGGSFNVSMGACSVATFRSTGSFVDPIKTTPLDVGAAITLNRAGETKQLAKQGDAYYADLGSSTVIPGLPNIPGLPASTPGFLEQGTYQISAPGGSGPNGIGPFNLTFTMPALLAWSNEGAVNTITRSAGQTITWTGGDPNGTVQITGTSISGDAVAFFICNERTSAGTFTIPSYVLLLMPPSSSQTPGIMTVSGVSAQQRFNATGLDYGYISATGATSKSVTFR